MKMKMRCFFFWVFFFFVLNVSAQKGQKVTGCGFKVPPRSMVVNSFQSIYEARNVVQQMLDTIRWKENFTLQEVNNIRNAYATIINGKRYIVFDNNFLEDIDAYALTKWASISVMAHEMGHHYYNHVVSSQGSTPSKELEADAFSGYVMERLGATLDQSLAAMKAVASDQASSTHPGKNDRLNAITQGWNMAQQAVAPSSAPSQSTATTMPRPQPPVKPQPTKIPRDVPGTAQTTIPPVSQQSSTPDNDPSWIVMTVQSDKDVTFYLSDDGKTYQPAIIKAGQPFAFKFEIYRYGWLKLPYYNGSRIFKLNHGKDYAVLWNRRNGNWTVVEVPQ